MQNKKNDKRALWIRIICAVLVFMMLASAAYYAIMAIVISVSANPFDGYSIDADTNANIYVSCGIYYGETALDSAAVTTSRGFIIGEAEITNSVRKFTPYISLEGVTSIAASPLTFLSMQDGKYLPCDASAASVLPYRIELSADSGDVWELADEIEALVASAKDMFSVKGISNGKKVLKYGAFSDAATASTAAGEFEALLSGLNTLHVNISIPTGTGICLYDTANGEILFEFDSTDTKSRMPAVFPMNGTDGSVGGTVLPNGNTYYDAMCFSRQDSMINIINLVELNTYVEGVLPSEIYTSWALEVQKAFAIIVRSYTVASLCGKHFSGYNFDLCSTADCQAYQGRYNVKPSIIQAVSETGYNVMSTNGAIMSAYYAAVNGGESILTTHAWGGTNPSHIVSQKTPWEEYTKYINNRGYWFYEFTPEQLTLQLRSKGYTNVTEPIVGISVNSRAGDTNYVYSTTYTDKAGNTQTITRTSRNYGALGVRSANYNIGFDSVDYYLDEVISIDVKRMTNQNTNPLVSVFNVLTNSGIFQTSSASASVLTDSGTFSLPQSAIHALTENGTVTLEQSNFTASVPDENGYYTAINVYGDTVITTQLKRTYHTYTASALGNIVVAGKGWGHGIGMSQYGARDLADWGAEYDQIIRAYYANTEIVSISELRGME